MRVALAADVGRHVVSALMRTVDVQVEDPHRVGHPDLRDYPVLYAFWHGSMVPLLFRHRDQGARVLVSRHGDGEIIARVLESYGYETARGSSSRGGVQGLREMLRAVQGQRRDLAITPDGPRGPRHVAKKGLIATAQGTGLPIVPIAAAPERAKTLGSWDGFMIPYPFSRVHVVYGAPWRVDPQQTGADGLAHVQRELEQVTTRAAALAAQGSEGG